MIPDGGMSFEMEKYFRSIDPNSDYKAGRILQLNADHKAVQQLKDAITADPNRAGKLAELLYCQGVLMANLTLDDPTAYTALVLDLI